jgi:hypothetical protein
MIIEQTVEIPDGRRLAIELPEGLIAPAFTPAGEHDRPVADIEEVTAELRELCRDSDLTVERFLALRREDLELEEAEYRRMFGKGEPE